MSDYFLGTATQLALAPTGTPLAEFPTAVEFLRESIRRECEWLSTAGLRGTRGQPIERSRPGPSVVRGELVLHPTGPLLAQLWPLILGTPPDLPAGTPAATTFRPAERLPAFDLLLDRGPRRFVYRHCLVDRAVLRGRAGQLLELRLELLGREEELSTEPFPPLAPGRDAPYVFHDGQLGWCGQLPPFVECELTVHNALQVQWFNSPAPGSIQPVDRQVTLACTVPWGTPQAGLYRRVGTEPAQAVLQFTNGSSQLRCELPRLEVHDRTPVVVGRGELRLALFAHARTTVDQPELLVTNTP
ncbi:MAG: hypothetical protein ACKOGA_15000 [Planctomycetaceae bacterium]